MADPRGGFVDAGGGFIGERPQQLPPSLLQMAQGGGGGVPDWFNPQGGGGGGGWDLRGGAPSGAGGGPVPYAPFGEGWQSDPELNAGAPYRAITSPEDQNWSDRQGRPIHMGGPPPAFNPGRTIGDYNAVFDPRAPSSTGGWFTMADYNKGNPEGRGLSNKSDPGSNRLSTNNWRLLGNDPDLFMINGSVVSRRAAQTALAPRSVLGVEGAEPKGYYHAGEGKWTIPFGSGGAMTGYIGSGDPWSIFATPTY